MDPLGWKILMVGRFSWFLFDLFVWGTFACLYIYIFNFIIYIYIFIHTHCIHDPKYKIGHNLLVDFRYDPYDNAERNGVFDCVTTPGKISMEFENRLFWRGNNLANLHVWVPCQFSGVCVPVWIAINHQNHQEIFSDVRRCLPETPVVFCKGFVGFPWLKEGTDMARSLCKCPFI